MRLVLALSILLGCAAIGCGSSSGGDDMMQSPTDGGGDGGLPYGATCTQNSDCASMACFVGGMRSFCSMHCTQATVATDCPVPPTTGICNMQGYCK